MPRASGQKYHYQDHDSDVVDEAPPVQNTWYEVFHAYDVRLLWCVLEQDNEENAAKTCEVRWTIDGNVYFASISLDDATAYFVFRNHLASAGGTAGLSMTTTFRNAAGFPGKRGQDCKVEVRITDVLGTNQRLQCWCVRETLELT
ncbi:hypothetical protein CEE36_11335 [candidate division TA06 bacterium B3_TA06]|uniref:Uncharacterized protein n=1 Tax=candidate division TA06 bacterium B3_TA06 TaxID=2012487 RepID=A0A532UPP8_UNCT6|nr:MAG: hypothetical protein CEE36_11335 [candidate division TA06 bacterium B3_TA06]